MSTSTVRGSVMAAITDDLPDTWRQVPGLWTVVDVTTPVMWMEYSALEPSAVLPGSHVDVTVDLCIVTQYKDMRLAEDEADEDVLGIYGALLEYELASAVRASKTVWEDQYLGWRVACTVTLPNEIFTQPDPAPEPDPEP